MRHHFISRKRVAFHETDMAGIAHFSNFFRWMEETEHRFLKEIGCPPVVQEGERYWGWPRIKASCDFRAPLRFDDAFECHLFVKEIKLRSVVYFFRLMRVDPDGSRQQAARGEITSVYAHFDASENTMEAVQLSDEFLERIREATSEEMRLPKEDSVSGSSRPR